MCCLIYCYESVLFNMTLEFGLTGGHKFKPTLCNLNICSLFVYLKVHKGFYLIYLILHEIKSYKS